MPYIRKFNREALDKIVNLLKKDRLALPAGELNYLITKILSYAKELNGESYSTYNELIGVLECVKFELYRRKIVPYENKKKKENGDVY